TIAAVGEELETIEAGLAELGTCESLFDPAKLGPQNVTYYTPFVSSDVRQVGELMDRLHREDPRMQQAYLDNGNTYLGGQNFEYLADPIKILKGRLIIGAIFVLYALSGYLSSYLSLVFILILALMTPFIIVKSLAFNLAYTSHRNIRFSFVKDYPGAYMIYFVWGLITVLTLYLGFPAALRRFYNYVFKGVKYGDANFEFKDSESLYPIYIGAFFLQLAIVLGVTILGGGVVFLAKMISSTVELTGGSTMVTVATAAITIAVYGSSFYTYAVVRTWTFEYFSRQFFIKGARMESSLVAGELGMINFTNFLLILFTVGFGTPWAIVRFRKYTLEKLAMVIPSAQMLDEFVSSQSKKESAEGDAAADIFDVDFDFGF
ncbi:MAG: DUF898 family protein, partial [Pseudomonadota bacterium]